jgi:hypothetical protein
MNEQVAKMRLDALRRNQAEAAATQAAEVVKEQLKAKGKQLATRAALRLAGGTAAATVIGMFITYGIWAIQFLAGNLSRSKIIPKLELWEIICFAIATIIFMALIVFLVVLLKLLVDPWSTGKAAFEAFGDWVIDKFK